MTAEKADPCRLLPSALQDKYGLTGPGDANLTDVTGPSCSFIRRTPADPVVVVGVNTQSMGLEGLYERESNFRLFEPVTVNDYPGLFLNPAGGPEICSIDLAVNPSELLFVDVVPGQPSPPAEGVACDKARQIMVDILVDFST